MTMDKKDYLICALDTENIFQVHKWINELQDTVGMYKLGLELFTNNAMSSVDLLTHLDIPIFLDLKFYDIPNTVYKTVRNFNRY